MSLQPQLFELHGHLHRTFRRRTRRLVGHAQVAALPSVSLRRHRFAAAARLIACAQPPQELRIKPMRKNTSLYYLAVLGFALAVPLLLHKDKAPGAPGKLVTRPTSSQGEEARLSVPSAPALAAPVERTVMLETPQYSALVSSLNGGIKSFRLKDPQFKHEGRPIDVVTTDKPSFYPLTFKLAGATLGAEPAWQMQSLSEKAVRFHTFADGIGIERKLETGTGPYQVWVTTTLENRDSRVRKLVLADTTHHYVLHAAESGSIPFLPARSSAISGGLCYHGSDLEREDRKHLLAGKDWRGGVRFAAIENVYFLNALVAADQTADGCRLESSDRGHDGKGGAVGTLLSATLRHVEIVLAPGEKRTVRVLGYLGPKTPEELSRAGHALRKAINTGFFTSLADGLTALLAMIHGTVGNWGVAIILLTFFVKLTLYPLTHKQMASMAKMKGLKPEMDRINELYADDREKKGAAVMELYRKKGVNPMAGCFPVLLQLPIWFSLYSSLSSNIRLLHAPFALWWTDLSSPDPYFVLPLALGVLMFVQQKLAPPTGADPLQAKMMLYMMPTMITSFMLFLPAGLCLYMFTNSALSIVQQRVIESRLKITVPATASSSSMSVAGAGTAGSDDQTAQAGSREKTAQRRLRRGRK
jgi:YidC/Oxa1 family membrane protein insertase